MTLHRLVSFLGGLAMAYASSGDARAASAQTYVLDPVHTQVVFFADHLGFSHGIGRLRIQSGWFQFDAQDWTTARADVVIDMTSLDMGDGVVVDRTPPTVTVPAAPRKVSSVIGSTDDSWISRWTASASPCSAAPPGSAAPSRTPHPPP